MENFNKCTPFDCPRRVSIMRHYQRSQSTITTGSRRSRNSYMSDSDNGSRRSRNSYMSDSDNGAGKKKKQSTGDEEIGIVSD